MPILRAESSIERACRERAAKAGMLTVKLHQRGWPDRLFLSPHGEAFFVEFKRKGQKPKSIQQHWIDKLSAAGFDAYVVTDMEEVEYVLSRYS